MWKIFIVWMAMNGEPHYNLYFMDGALQDTEYPTYEACARAALAQSEDVEMAAEMSSRKDKLIGSYVGFGCMKRIKKADPFPTGNETPEVRHHSDVQ